MPIFPKRTRPHGERSGTRVGFFHHEFFFMFARETLLHILLRTRNVHLLIIAFELVKILSCREVYRQFSPR